MAKKKNEDIPTRSVQDILTAFGKLNKTEIIVMDETSIKKDIPKTSFGSIKLDIASGIGGAPWGRMIEVYGPESSGKTSISVMLCAQAQKRGNFVFYCTPPL